MLSQCEALDGEGRVVIDADGSGIHTKYLSHSGLVRISGLCKDNNPRFGEIVVGHLGGSFVSGDRVRTSVAVCSDVVLTIRCQSAVKAFDPRDPAPRVHNRYVADDGATLLVLGEPIIVGESSSLDLITDIEVASSAQVVVVETYGPGWAQDGSEFSFRCLRTTTCLSLDGKLVLRDALKLGGNSTARAADYRFAGSEMDRTGLVARTPYEGFRFMSSVVIAGSEAFRLAISQALEELSVELCRITWHDEFSLLRLLSNDSGTIGIVGDTIREVVRRLSGQRDPIRWSGDCIDTELSIPRNTPATSES